MGNSDYMAWNEIETKFGKKEEDVVPDPETYPGYGWGYHGPWDDEYWDEVGGRPDERW